MTAEVMGNNTPNKVQAKAAWQSRAKQAAAQTAQVANSLHCPPVVPTSPRPQLSPESWNHDRETLAAGLVRLITASYEAGDCSFPGVIRRRSQRTHHEDAHLPATVISSIRYREPARQPLRAQTGLGGDDFVLLRVGMTADRYMTPVTRENNPALLCQSRPPNGPIIQTRKVGCHIADSMTRHDATFTTSDFRRCQRRASQKYGCNSGKEYEAGNACPAPSPPRGISIPPALEGIARSARHRLPAPEEGD